MKDNKLRILYVLLFVGLSLLLIFWSSCNSNKVTKVSEIETLETQKEQQNAENRSSWQPIGGSKIDFEDYLEEDCDNFVVIQQQELSEEDMYEDGIRVETRASTTAPPQQKLSKKKGMKKKGVLIRKADAILSALQQQNLKKAGKYGSSYALGMFLYLDIETLRSFEVVKQEVFGKTGFAYAKINNFKRLLPMMFEKEGGSWRFKSLDIGKFLAIDEVDLWKRQRFTMDEIAK